MTIPYFVNNSNEDTLKILKVEYLSNNLLDPTQILNLTNSLNEDTSNERQPQSITSGISQQPKNKRCGSLGFQSVNPDVNSVCLSKEGVPQP